MKKMNKTLKEQLEKVEIIKKDQKKIKVLILSLGVGDIFKTTGGKSDGEPNKTLTREEKRDKILNGEIKPYDPTKYSYFDKDKGKDTEIKSAFVAEPLLKMFRPDEIVVIGTSKSAWTSFFRAFGDDNELKNKRMADLFDLEDKGGKDIDVVQEDYAGKIEKIYRAGITSRDDFKNKKIYVIVTRYGMNSEELLDNYSIISGKMASILSDREAKYEIAFDITHSFRSMPIYNLAILNYLQNTAMATLEISHVYYGNLEVKYENNHIAPVLDLNELVNVMNLSGSVNEFRNTGNAATLLRYIPDTQKELRDALEQFDLATQINANDMAIESLKRLIEVCKEGDGSGKYADLCKMILSVVQEKFFKESNIQDMCEKINKMSLGEKQYRLSLWYHTQNRYGLAVATALEAVKSYLVGIFIERTATCSQDIKNEDDRESALKSFKSLARDLAKQGRSFGGKLEEEICSFEKARKIAEHIRNMFAHNLDSEILQERTNKSVDFPPEKIKPALDNFFEKFTVFVEMLDKNREEFKKLYI